MHSLSMFLPTLVLFLVAAALLATPAQAEVEGKAVDYTHGDVALRGYVAHDTAVTGPRPAVLIVHAWRGHGEFVQEQARRLAEQGYLAFALDMYGKGVYAKDNREAAALAGRFYGDRALMLARTRAGLEWMKQHPAADASRVGAMGYCFGGTVVLQLARDGEDLAGVVSFHGGLSFETEPTEGSVKAEVLVLHGADDPLVPPADVLAFWTSMQAAKAKYQIRVFSGAVHAFTDKAAGDDPSRGAAYDHAAAVRSWHAMTRHFQEVFGGDG